MAHRIATGVLLGALLGLLVGCRHETPPRPSDSITIDALVADRSSIGRDVSVRGHLTRADLLTSGAARVRVVWVGDAESPLDGLVGRDVQVEGKVGISYVALQPSTTDGAFKEIQDLEVQVSRVHE